MKIWGGPKGKERRVYCTKGQGKRKKENFKNKRVRGRKKKEKERKENKKQGKKKKEEEGKKRKKKGERKKEKKRYRE
jgi:hypothetical protein